MLKKEEFTNLDFLILIWLLLFYLSYVTYFLYLENSCDLLYTLIDIGLLKLLILFFIDVFIFFYLNNLLFNYSYSDESQFYLLSLVNFFVWYFTERILILFLFICNKWPFLCQIIL